MLASAMVDAFAFVVRSMSRVLLDEGRWPLLLYVRYATVKEWRSTAAVGRRATMAKQNQEAKKIATMSITKPVHWALLGL